MRKLASIRRIARLEPINGADSIELAHVDGWQSVVRKNEYSQGDQVIYVEIDSWVPIVLAPFLRRGGGVRTYNDVDGERVRSIKLRGVLSQGLILPLHILPPDMDSSLMFDGSDVSSVLGIQKWEAPIAANLAGKVRGNFPSLVPKTDQERVQNIAKELEENIYAGNRRYYKHFEITEKLEGTSCTFYLSFEGEFHVCSRNLSLVEDPTNTLWEIARRHDIESKMRLHNLYGFAIQGEVIGPGVQKNPYQLSQPEFFVYDVYNTIAHMYLPARHRYLIQKSMQLQHVPVLEHRVFGDSFNSIEEILLYAEGKSALNRKQEREGVVFKEISQSRFSFKAISNKYLLTQD